MFYWEGDKKTKYNGYHKIFQTLKTFNGPVTFKKHLFIPTFRVIKWTWQVHLDA